MGLIREPDGVKFIISGGPLSPEAAAEVSEWIRKDRESKAKAAREQLEANALKLPASERARLAHRLIDSLTEAESVANQKPSEKRPSRRTTRKPVRQLKNRGRSPSRGKAAHRAAP